MMKPAPHAGQCLDLGPTACPHFLQFLCPFGMLNKLKKWQIPIRTNSRKGRPNTHPASAKSGLLGSIFGSLTVVSYVHGGCLCRCACGQDKIVTPARLLNGSYKSCGCAKFRRGPDSPQWKGYKTIPKQYFLSLKHDAARRKLLFEITIEDIGNLLENQQYTCCLSGVSISMEEKTASLDRINSSSGYEVDNIQWVHKIVNEMKWDYNQQEFIEWCNHIANHVGKTRAAGCLASYRPG